MGRSRAVSQAAVDNHNQIRGKRKRTASGAEVAENSGTARKALAQEISEPKGAFYHCNYCNKDISGKIRIKCVVCPDFDLCIECLSVGAELTPHKCNHPYRVMDNLAFPLICPDWNVDEGDATARVPTLFFSPRCLPLLSPSSSSPLLLKSLGFYQSPQLFRLSQSGGGQMEG